MGIVNDKGADACYSLRPLPPAELGASVAAFRLVKVTDVEVQPVYVVRLSIDGQAACNCPQNHFGGSCKHADALIASGVLPCSLLAKLIDQTRLLDETAEKLTDVSARAQKAEAETLHLTEAAAEERRLHDHDCEWRANRIADMNEEIDRLEAEILRHQPKPRRRRAAVKEAA